MSHIHEKIDFTADAFIVNGDKVLLRMHDKYNMWLQVGGHIELDEDPLQSLFKEIKEECGLEVELLIKSQKTFQAKGYKDLPVPQFMLRHPVNNTHEHINLMYVVKALTVDIQPDPAEKPVEFKWFTSKELQDPQYRVAEHVQYYAARALEFAKQYGHA